MDLNSEQIDKIYQRIGEFAIAFQWLEHRFREIGWMLIDPNREHWPPTHLRNLRNKDLLEKVKSLYIGRIGSISGEGAQEYCKSFAYVIEEAHEARRLRNNLLHSAYIEIKGGRLGQEGREVLGIMRINPRTIVDEDGERKMDSEILSEDNLNRLVASLGPLAMAVNMHYTQLIHWLPFDNVQRLEDCGLRYHINGLPSATCTE